MRKYYLMFLLAFFISVTVFSIEKSIAVLYFDNTSGIADLEPLRKGLADMLITDLSKIKALKIIEREKLEELLKEIELSLSGIVDENSVKEIGKQLGAEFLLMGSYILFEDMMRIDTRLVNVETGEIELAEMVQGTRKTVFKMENDLVKKLVNGLVIDLSAKEKRQLQKVQATSYDALISYSNALDASDSGDYERAKKLFEQTVEIDPDFEIAYDRLDEIGEFIESLLMSRSLGISVEIIRIIDKIASGNKQYCDSFWSRYWSMTQPLMSAVGYLQTFDDDGNWKPDLSIIQSQWKVIGLPQEPVTIDDTILEIGKNLYKSYVILDYLLSKRIPDDPCGMVHPNEAGLAYFIQVLHFAQGDIGRGNTRSTPNMLNDAGEIVITRDSYDDLIIKYGNEYLHRFPYGNFAINITSQVDAALQRKMNED